jgi:hypothetical protein
VKNVVRKQSDDYFFIATNFHEASHAIIGLHNYLQVYNVNILLPAIKEGTTDFFIFDTDKIKDEELKQIFLLFELQTIYGGLIGEKLYYKDITGSDKFPFHLKSGSASDIYQAATLIRKHNLSKPGKNTFLLKKRIQNDVEELLLEHWDAVKVIAHALYKKKKLNFLELKKLLTTKTNHNEFWKDRFKKIKIIYNDNNIPADYVVKDMVLEDLILSI